MKAIRVSANMLCVILFCLSLTSCNDKDETPASPKPDKAALKEFFDGGIHTSKQMFTLNSSTGGNITGDLGTILNFNTDAFLTLNGEAVTGNVAIEFIEIYNRSSMLLTKRPTIGRNGNDDMAMLISGGEFYVNAFQNGVQLKPASGFTIVAPTENTGGIDQDMRLFTGLEECVDDDCDIIWEENEDRGIEVGEFQDAGGFQTAYFVFQSQFGWTNIDRWYNDPRPKTTIFVDVPEGFDDSNCAVFIAYDGEPTALGRLDKYDVKTGMFTEHYGLIPIGLEVHFILVSIIDDEIHYAIQGATIKENHVEVITEVKSITEADLIELINKLP
jgi:hypothetical protein